MPHYLIQAEFTAAAQKAMIENPSNREEAATPLVEALGGKMVCYYFTADMTRAFAIYEAPNKGAMSAGALAVGASGAFTSISTTGVVTAAEAMEVMAAAKVAASTYNPVTG